MTEEEKEVADHRARCDRCTHPKWIHAANGCHDIACCPFRIGMRKTGPSLCLAFIEKEERERDESKDTDEDHGRQGSA